MYDQAMDSVSPAGGAVAPPRPAAGSILGSRYQLIEDIDPTNPGRIFHAEDTVQKRRVRLRIIRCPEQSLAVVREQVARIQGAANANFVAVLAVERNNAFGYVVSEWLEGFALLDLLRVRRELTVRETLALVGQIAPAIDAARDLRVSVSLELRDVLVHFPESFEEPNEQVILRCPIAEWPAYVVKLDPLGTLDEIEEAAADQTMVGAPQGQSSTAISRVASITYDLLGGKAGASGPIANLSESANGVLRNALSGRGNFSSAQQFVTELGKAIGDGAPRPSQAIAPPEPKPTAPTATPPPAPPSAPPPAPVAKPEPAPARSSSPAAPVARQPETQEAPSRASHIPWGMIVGAVVLVAVVAAGFFIFSGDKAAPKQTAQTPAVVASVPIPAAAPRATPQPGKPWKNSLGMTYIPLDDIWMAATETRVRDFDAFVQATNYDATGGMDSLQRDGLKDHGQSWRNPGFKQSPENPVVGISREDAKYFCKWLTDKERATGAMLPGQRYRLPTDREWSIAVGLPAETGATPEDRSGRVKGVYPWGHVFPPPGNAGNYAGAEASEGAPENWPVLAGYHDSFPRTCPVPSYGPNEHGLYDFGGNVWEWCLDPYGKTNPRWGVLRGGSWATSKQEEMLSSYRRGFDPSFRADDVGFRCAIATDAGDR
jgi:formylglycine-generating enzyme required for sulfatase activity